MKNQILPFTFVLTLILSSQITVAGVHPIFQAYGDRLKALGSKAKLIIDYLKKRWAPSRYSTIETKLTDADDR